MLCFFFIIIFTSYSLFGGQPIAPRGLRRRLEYNGPAACLDRLRTTPAQYRLPGPLGAPYPVDGDGDPYVSDGMDGDGLAGGP